MSSKTRKRTKRKQKQGIVRETAANGRRKVKERENKDTKGMGLPMTRNVVKAHNNHQCRMTPTAPRIDRQICKNNCTHYNNQTRKCKLGINFKSKG